MGSRSFPGRLISIEKQFVMLKLTGCRQPTKVNRQQKSFIHLYKCIIKPEKPVAKKDFILDRNIKWSLSRTEAVMRHCKGNYISVVLKLFKTTQWDYLHFVFSKASLFMSVCPIFWVISRDSLQKIGRKSVHLIVVTSFWNFTGILSEPMC